MGRNWFTHPKPVPWLDKPLDAVFGGLPGYKRSMRSPAAAGMIAEPPQFENTTPGPMPLIPRAPKQQSPTRLQRGQQPDLLPDFGESPDGMLTRPGMEIPSDEVRAKARERYLGKTVGYRPSPDGREMWPVQAGGKQQKLAEIQQTYGPDSTEAQRYIEALGRLADYAGMGPNDPAWEAKAYNNFQLEQGRQPMMPDMPGLQNYGPNSVGPLFDQQGNPAQSDPVGASTFELGRWARANGVKAPNGEELGTFLEKMYNTDGATADRIRHFYSQQMNGGPAGAVPEHVPQAHGIFGDLLRRFAGSHDNLDRFMATQGNTGGLRGILADVAAPIISGFKPEWGKKLDPYVQNVQSDRDAYRKMLMGGPDMYLNQAGKLSDILNERDPYSPQRMIDWARIDRDYAKNDTTMRGQDLKAMAAQRKIELGEAERQDKLALGMGRLSIDEYRARTAARGQEWKEIYQSGILDDKQNRTDIYGRNVDSQVGHRSAQDASAARRDSIAEKALTIKMRNAKTAEERNRIQLLLGKLKQQGMNQRQSQRLDYDKNKSAIHEKEGQKDYAGLDQYQLQQPDDSLYDEIDALLAEEDQPAAPVTQGGVSNTGVSNTGVNPNNLKPLIPMKADPARSLKSSAASKPAAKKPAGAQQTFSLEDLLAERARRRRKA